MKLFDIFKNTVKPDWIFSQNGNMWRFVFAGKNAIAGETRNPETKTLKLFTLDTTSGKTFLENFLFEDGNYWIEIEGANSSMIFLNRFEKPELPYHRNIIALDLITGATLWENCEYQYFFSTEDTLYGRKPKFESVEYAELSAKDGSILRIFPESENNFIIQMKHDTDDELFEESTNYPREWAPDNTNINNGESERISAIIRKEIKGKNSEGTVEFVIKKNLLMFNYYIPAGIDMNDLNKKYYRNVLSIYEVNSTKKIFEDILNKQSTFNMPDNFFIRGDMLFYLREKKEIAGINLVKFKL